MKWMVVLLSVACLFTGIAVADNNPVRSINTVGYVRVGLNNADFGLVSIPFSRTDGGATVNMDELLPDAPSGSVAYFYRNNQWVSPAEEVKFDVNPGPKQYTVHWVPGTNEFIRGDSVLLNNLSGAPATYTVAGEVPDSRTAPTTTVVVVQGFTLVGFSYPVDVALDDAGINPSQQGEVVYVFEGGQWLSSTYKFDVDPGPGQYTIHWVPNRTIKAGQGLLYNAFVPGGYDWDQIKPYTTP